jgi:hypothetical protein
MEDKDPELAVSPSTSVNRRFRGGATATIGGAIGFCDKEDVDADLDNGTASAEAQDFFLDSPSL